MIPKRSLSVYFRATKLAGLVMSAATLGACVSEPGPTQGSSSSLTAMGSSSSAPNTTPSSIASVASSSSVAQASTVRVQAQDYSRFNESDNNRDGATSGRCSQGMVDLVDVTDNGGTCAVGYVAAGEWVEYDVANLVPGTYSIVLRTSSQNAGRRVQVSVAGASVGEVDSVGNGWESYVDNTLTSVAIRSNSAVVRVTFADGEANLNYFDLVPTGGGLPPVSSVPSSVAPPSSAASSSVPSGGVSINDADDFTTQKGQFEANNCQLCHQSQGGGLFTAAGAPSGPIDISYALSPAGFPALVEAISATMPKNGAGDCTAVNNCALNTAAYMVNLVSGGDTPQSSSSSSAGTPMGSDYADFTPDLEMGRILYEETASLGCAACHDAAEEFAPKIQGFDSDQDLFASIVDTMPASGDGSRAGECVGQCAADITAYLSRVISQIVVSSCSPDDPVTYGIRKMRLLTAQQYINTVEDLGIAQSGDVEISDLVVDDYLIANSFAPHSTTVIDSSRHFKFMTIAERLADSAANRISNGCNSADQCANRFNDFVTRIYRRPLTGEERATFADIFGEFGDQGMAVALQTALMSPHFLYRSESGVSVADARNNNGLGLQNLEGLRDADSNAYVLDAYEFATALSYMYTGSTPDQMLLQAAGNGGLNSDAAVATQIERLLSTQRGQEHIGRFAGKWMRTDAVVNQSRPDFPAFTEQVAEDMAEEVRQLFRHVFYSDGVPFEDFYSGDYAVVNNNLAQFYGIPFNGNGWAKTGNLPNRGGIITTGAFMTNNATNERTGPILRAVRIRELMLCHHIDPPPANLGDDRTQLERDGNMERNMGMMTSRRLFEVFTDSPACASCHANAINPLFGVEDFDQIGRFRTTMQGLPGVSIARENGTFDNTYLGNAGVQGLDIENYGELRGTASIKGSDVISFNGSKDLGDKIATLPSVRECMVTNAFRYTTGLPIGPDAIYKEPDGSPKKQEPTLSQEQVEDFTCAKDVLESEYVSSHSNAKEVFKKIGTLELIRFRK